MSSEEWCAQDDVISVDIDDVKVILFLGCWTNVQVGSHTVGDLYATALVSELEPHSRRSTRLAWMMYANMGDNMSVVHPESDSMYAGMPLVMTCAHNGCCN